MNSHLFVHPFSTPSWIMLFPFEKEKDGDSALCSIFRLFLLLLLSLALSVSLSLSLSLYNILCTHGCTFLYVECE